MGLGSFGFKLPFLSLQNLNAPDSHPPWQSNFVYDCQGRGISLAQLLHLGANPHKKDAPEVQTPGDEDPTIRAK